MLVVLPRYKTCSACILILLYLVSSRVKGLVFGSSNPFPAQPFAMVTTHEVEDQSKKKKLDERQSEDTLQLQFVGQFVVTYPNLPETVERKIYLRRIVLFNFLKLTSLRNQNHIIFWSNLSSSAKILSLSLSLLIIQLLLIIAKVNFMGCRIWQTDHWLMMC